MIEYQDFNSNKIDYHDIRLWYNFSYPPHLHQSMELIIMKEGEMSLTVEGVKEDMCAGQLALILSNQIHSFEISDNSVAYVHVFSTDVVEQFTRQLGTRSGVKSVFRCDKNVERYILSCVDKMVESIDVQNRNESTSNKEIYNGNDLPPQMLFAISYLYAVCDQYLRNVSSKCVPLQDTGIAHKIILYITEHFTENITLNDIAEELGYEPHYLSRCFNKTIGLNIRQMINIYRINYARHLLIDTKASIAEIALQCGFQSIRNFNRIFKKIEGKTPKEYRNNL